MKIRRLVPFVVLIALIGLLFVAVFPTRTWLAQRRERAEALEQLHVLDEQNQILTSRVEALHSDDEIERLAREQYNLVRPGEEAYALLPPPGSTATTVAPPVEEAEEESDRSLPGKVWHFLTGWL
jgi:cell division protein FtsB